MDPSLGRLISEDTYEGDITNPLSLNLYTYVKNNPLKYVDPTGNRPYAVKIGDDKYGLVFTSQYEDYIYNGAGAIPWIGPWANKIANTFSKMSTWDDSELGEASKILNFSEIESTSMETLEYLSNQYGQSTKGLSKKFGGVIKWGGKALGLVGTLATFEDFYATYNFDYDTDQLIKQHLENLMKGTKEEVLAKYIYAKVRVNWLIDEGRIKYQPNTKKIQYSHNWIWEQGLLTEVSEEIMSIKKGK